MHYLIPHLYNQASILQTSIEGTGRSSFLNALSEFWQVELGDLRTKLGKVQDETEELEREKEMTLVGGARERLLIMERVESLSQLYLGGLEEVRQDLGHVKFGCSERVEEIESQWNDFKRNQGITCEDGNTLLSRQVMVIYRMMVTMTMTLL